MATDGVGVDQGPIRRRGATEIDLLGRLRPDVTLEHASSELTALTRHLEADAASNVPRGLVPVVRSFHDAVVGDVRPAMLALFAAVTLVLLIASANVANLLLMRGEARRAELALRVALGAGPGRIVRQIFAESLLLALAAGVVGLGITYWSLDVLIAFVPGDLPRLDSVRVDPAVIAFTMAAAFLAAALSGLAPTLSSTRGDPALHLRGGGTGLTGAQTGRVRRALVVVQVALAVTVLAAAGVLTRSLLRLQAIETGLTTDALVFVDLTMPEAKHADRAWHAAFLDEVASRLSDVPHVTSATPVNVPPFSGEAGWDVPRYTAEGQSAERAATNPALNLESIHPNYFQTFGVTVV